MCVDIELSEADVLVDVGLLRDPVEVQLLGRVAKTLEPHTRRLELRGGARFAGHGLKHPIIR